jgi:hypothetical protein
MSRTKTLAYKFGLQLVKEKAFFIVIKSSLVLYLLGIISSRFLLTKLKKDNEREFSRRVL